MKKLRLYLDTTILNFLFADDSPEECRLTQKFFKQIKSFDVFISEVVLREVYRCAQPKQKKLLDIIDRYDLEVLDYTEEADQLAETYIKKGIIPVKYRDDANHIAVASLNNCDVLSWNFQHIVKVKTKREVSVINLHKGYNSIDIFTPREVVEDFRQSKALKEINKIQEKIYHEEKNVSSKDRVARIHREAEALRKKFTTISK